MVGRKRKEHLSCCVFFFLLVFLIAPFLFFLSRGFASKLGERGPRGELGMDIGLKMRNRKGMDEGRYG